MNADGPRGIAPGPADSFAETHSPALAPYPAVARDLLAAGWSPLPLPEGQKASPPGGFTGADGPMASGADVEEWATDPARARANTAVRTPPDVIGIDVDAYKASGRESWTQVLDEVGPPPPTCRVSARFATSPDSGIRLFRLPPGISEADLVGGLPGIEIIRHGHRYFLAPGSQHPDGPTYAALNEATGEINGHLPRVEDLPVIPAAWLAPFTRAARGAAGAGEAPDALTPGRPCRRVLRSLAEFTVRLGDGTSRHDTMAAGTMSLLSLGVAGHSGVKAATDEFRLAVIEAYGVAGGPEGRTLPAREVAVKFSDACRSALAKIDPVAEDLRGCCEPIDAEPDYLGAPAPGQASQTSAGVPLADDEGPPWRYGGDLATKPPNGLLPTLLARTDGACLIYPGVVHNFVGESESGKTWLALAAVAETVRAGRPVVYVDYEDVAANFVARLRVLGVTDAEMAHVHYYEADAPWRAAPDDLLAAHGPVLVVLDGASEGMGLLGLDPTGTTDAVAWVAWVRRWTSGGASVILIDHVVKDRNSQGRWALGSQHKVAGVFAHFVIEPIGVLAPGRRSKVAIRVGKDRPGEVRAVAGEAVGARLQEVGTFEFGGPLGVPMGWAIAPPDGAAAVPARGGSRRAAAESFVRARLAGAPEPVGLRAILAGRPEDLPRREIEDAIERLVASGEVLRSGGGPGRKVGHRLAADAARTWAQDIGLVVSDG